MPTHPIRFRDFETDDVVGAHRLSRAVLWPHREEDWRFVAGLGRGVVAVDGDAVVGTGLCWLQGPRFATLGMIIVAPDRQGGGIGGLLLAKLLDMAGDRSVLLNATAEGASLYRRAGFVPGGEIRQHQGVLAAPPDAASEEGDRIAIADRGALETIIGLDAQATGLDRSASLSALIAAGEATVLERQGAPAGFSILRRFGRGVVIGPVVAPDAVAARRLIEGWLPRLRGAFVRVDIPVETGLAPWLTQLGLTRAGAVTTMVRGPAPVRDGPARLHALISQALG